jgi:hypothetical protein
LGWTPGNRHRTFIGTIHDLEDHVMPTDRRLPAAWRRATVALATASLAFVLTTAGGRADAAGAAGSDQDLAALERSRLQALVDADVATAEDLMSSDFELVNPGGATLARDDYLGAVGAGIIDYLVFEPASAIDVRRFGSSAMLRFEVRFDLVIGGELRLTHGGWITELYELRGGRWKIVWEQATAIPNDFDLFVQSLLPPA